MASILRWLITEYAHSWVDNELDVYVVTDVPVHLTLCWTVKPERLTLQTKVVRGVSVMAAPYYCFTECTPVEQDQPGDTTEHTFIIPDWETCTRRWWRFTGTIGGVDSPSSSPIFTAHKADQEDAMPLKHTALEEKEVAGVIDHADNSITPAKLADPFTFPSFPFTPASAPTQDYHVANKKYVDDRGAGAKRSLWADPGGVAGGGVTLHSSISSYPCTRFLDGISGQLVEFSIPIPGDFVSLSKAVVVIVSAWAGTGNLYRLVQTTYSKSGEAIDTHQQWSGYQAVPMVSNVILDDDISAVLTSLEAGDRLGIAFIRDGSNPLDTVNTNVYIIGVLIEYNT